MAGKKFKDSLNDKYDYLGNLFDNKKIRVALVILALLFLIILGSWVRTLNMSRLEDTTTGEKIPLALDPYYFLRIAETKLEQGELPSDDNMRFPSADISFSKEILPSSVILMYKVSKIFNPSITLRYIDVISPVVFFILGLIAFFFFAYFLTKSKWIAIISSAFLAVIPSYLYRTMAGFADHESPGMFAFFLALAIFTLSMNYLDKESKPKDGKKEIFKITGLALLVGFLSSLVIVSWGGIANYIFMIIPLSFLIFWIVKNQKELKNYIKEKYILFYILWVISSIIFVSFFGYSILKATNKYLLSGQGAIVPFVLLFIIIDYIAIISYKKGSLPDWARKKIRLRPFFSIIITFILGLIGLAILKGEIIQYIGKILQRLIRPSGTGRLGVTVAENRAPFLNEWIKTNGKIFFWFFYLGMVLFGIKLSKGIRENKKRILLALSWIVLISGILFSRISRNHILNGTNFISMVVYFGSIFIFFGVLSWIYYKSKIKLESGSIIIGSWLFFMLISGRGAIRMFFLITPVICFMVGYLVINLFDFAKKSRDEVGKIILWTLFIFVVLGCLISFTGHFQTAKQQAKYTSPSANQQWQGAMQWVRNNTIEGEIFIHWWDYGYWVQYLGERPTVTDGGHRVGYWDHLIGRYLLTTPKPKTALSLMKSHNVSYLLIDPTDLGKYGAYSSIGSGPNREDRRSQIPIMRQDTSQVRETANKTIRFYPGGSYLDKDIIYTKDNKKIFLPEGKAAIGGIILRTGERIIELGNESLKTMTMEQPEGVFIYNGNQYKIPFRYLYYNGRMQDFETGIEAVAYPIPTVSQSGGSFSINNLGSIIYLSPITSQSLFAQLYLMDDPFNEYSTLEVAHKEYDQFMQMLKMQDDQIGDFVVYRGFRGPIKIWETNYPENILIKEEFLETNVPEEGYGSLDDLQFAKE